MAVQLGFATFEEALAALGEQGLDFSNIDAATLLDEELALGELAARLIAASIAKKTLALVGQGVNAEEALAQALARYDAEGAFDTNLRVAYSHGRYKRGKRSKTMGFVTFSTMGDARVRPTHQALDGTTLPADDPFWDTHWTPLGYRCRCRTYFANERQLRKLGRTVLDEAPEEKLVEYLNPLTGEREKVPASIDPGWLVDGKSPAIDPAASLGKVLSRKLEELRAIPVPKALPPAPVQGELDV